MTATRVSINGIKEAIQTILQAANTTTASPIDLSANLANSQRVMQVLKIHPEMIRPQASFFPLVTCYIPMKEHKSDQIAGGQLNGNRRATVPVVIVGSIWNDNLVTIDEDPADEDIAYLMENIELALRKNETLNSTVAWHKTTSVKYYLTPLNEQTHLRSGLLTLECEVFY
jgi:hypothetical protein